MIRAAGGAGGRIPPKLFYRLGRFIVGNKHNRHSCRLGGAMSHVADGLEAGALDGGRHVQHLRRRAPVHAAAVLRAPRVPGAARGWSRVKSYLFKNALVLRSHHPRMGFLPFSPGRAEAEPKAAATQAATTAVRGIILTYRTPTSPSSAATA